MSTIPEGSTHKFQGIFYKKTGEDWHWFKSGDWLRVHFSAFGLLNHQAAPIVDAMRQAVAAQNWTGEGLPPVGTVCEYSLGSVGPWFQCEIKYQLAGYPHEDLGEWALVVHCPHLERDQVAQSIKQTWCFRPIYPPEQIAADERAAAIHDMLDLVNNRELNGVSEQLGALYDAGYRRVEQ